MIVNWICISSQYVAHLSYNDWRKLEFTVVDFFCGQVEQDKINYWTTNSIIYLLLSYQMKYLPSFKIHIAILLVCHKGCSAVFEDLKKC